MRIAIDVRVADPVQPGQQRYLWRLGHWAATGGHDVHFLTVKPQGGSVALPAGTTLHRLDELSRADLRSRVLGLAPDVLLLNPERSRAYRGLHANVLRSAYGTDHYGQKMRSFRNPLEAGLRRGLRASPWELAERRWERAFYEDGPPPRVIAQSAYMRAEILDTYRVPADHVHVVHNAVDTHEFSPSSRAALRDEARARWAIPEGALCLLFLGHNYRLKGLWELLERMPDLGAGPEGVHLLVVGRGTGTGQRRKAARLVARHGLERRVTIAGPLRSSIEAHAAADALLHLSWHDSFGFVVLEAMACGLPVVTTRFVGASELIEPGANGFLVDPSDEAALRRVVADLGDVALRDRVGRAAAATAADHPEEDNFRAVLEVMRIAAGR